MSTINHQKLRELAFALQRMATPQKLLAFRAMLSPSAVLALLDELEHAFTGSASSSSLASPPVRYGVNSAALPARWHATRKAHNG